VTTRKLYNPSRYSRTIRISETFRADSITATLTYSPTIRRYGYATITRTFRVVNMRIITT